MEIKELKLIDFPDSTKETLKKIIQSQANFFCVDLKTKEQLKKYIENYTVNVKLY